MYKKILITLLGLFISTSAFASSSPATPAPGASSNQNQKQSDKLTFENVWARPTMLPSNNSAIYMTIKNNTDSDIVLIGASATDVANNTELHKSFVDDKGVTKMTALDKVVIPARGTVDFAPNGTHIMLFDLKHTLVMGDKFKAELKFEGMDPQTIDVLIKHN
jgi:hypothetical protein